jgi:hypothetical protein
MTIDMEKGIKQLYFMPFFYNFNVIKACILRNVAIALDKR